jgi:hypothetical protein
MRTNFVITFFLFICQFGFSQKNEFAIHVNTGLISFKGASVFPSSIIIIPDRSVTGNYVNDAFSNKPDLGIGLNFSYHKIFKNKIVAGAETGIEFLKHKMPITSAASISGNDPTKGTINYHSHFINANLKAGYQLTLRKKITIDLLAEINTAFGLGSLYEVGSVINQSNNEKIYVENDRNKLPIDIRPGIEMRLKKQKWGCIFSYCIGTTNYYKKYNGGNFEAYARVARIGISYLLSK